MRDACIVSSHYKEDIKWLENYFLPVVIVSKEGGDYNNINHDAYFNVHRIPNKLREAGSYLWFIVNYWNHLPERMFFIHGHETSDHMKMSLPDAIKKYYDKPFQDFNHYFTYNLKINEEQDLFVYWWEKMLGSRFGLVPDEVFFELGAQFVVSRSIVKNHPLSFYRRIYDYACDQANDSHFDYLMGVFFESIWPIIFNPEFVQFKKGD